MAIMGTVARPWRAPTTEDACVAQLEEQQRQLSSPPRLYGAPAYARPPMPVEESPRPFDPDDLPIAATQTDEERAWVESLPPSAFAPGGGVVIGAGEAPSDAQGTLQPRPFFLRALADRILRNQ
jgi:hypothetical protein